MRQQVILREAISLTSRGSALSSGGPRCRNLSPVAATACLRSLWDWTGIICISTQNLLTSFAMKSYSSSLKNVALSAVCQRWLVQFYVDEISKWELGCSSYRFTTFLITSSVGLVSLLITSKYHFFKVPYISILQRRTLYIRQIVENVTVKCFQWKIIMWFIWASSRNAFSWWRWESFYDRWCSCL